MNPEALAEILERLPGLVREVERLQAFAREGRNPTASARLGLARDSLADALTGLRALAERLGLEAKAEAEAVDGVAG
jgi:hypothetical protein